MSDHESKGSNVTSLRRVVRDERTDEARVDAELGAIVLAGPARSRARMCGDGDWCPVCQAEIRQEAGRWLRDLATWDRADPGAGEPGPEEIIFRQWEEHLESGAWKTPSADVWVEEFTSRERGRRPRG
jgi:hypothetical protein